jgi:hypothetical protein
VGKVCEATLAALAASSGFWRAARETLYFFLRDFEGRKGLSFHAVAIESCYVGD